MKRKKFTETQILQVLKQYEGGREALDVCREYGISKATLFNWRKKYSGMESSHIKELKALQDVFIPLMLYRSFGSNVYR